MKGLHPSSDWLQLPAYWLYPLANWLSPPAHVDSAQWAKGGTYSLSSPFYNFDFCLMCSVRANEASPPTNEASPLADKASPLTNEANPVGSFIWSLYLFLILSISPCVFHSKKGG